MYDWSKIKLALCVFRQKKNKNYYIKNLIILQYNTFVNVFYSYNYFFSFKNCVTYKTNSIEQCYIQLLTCQTPVKDWDKKFFNRNVTVKVRQFCVIQYWWDTNIEQPPRGSNKIQLSKKGPFRSMFRRF